MSSFFDHLGFSPDSYKGVLDISAGTLSDYLGLHSKTNPLVTLPTASRQSNFLGNPISGSSGSSYALPVSQPSNFLPQSSSGSPFDNLLGKLYGKGGSTGNLPFGPLAPPEVKTPGGTDIGKSVERVDKAVDRVIQSSGAASRPNVGSSVTVPDQFGDPTLSLGEAYAACGPAAAISFAQKMGRTPTLREAVDLAKEVGWTEAQGMAGPASEVNLLRRLGVATRLATPNIDEIIQEIQGGNPVILDTPGHYFVVDQYDPSSGSFHVGNSGKAYRAGSDWLTWDGMQKLSGEIRNAIYLDNPLSSSPSIAGETGPEPQDPRITIVRRARSVGGDEFARAVDAILTIENGLDNPIGDNGSSFGPFQFHQGGELNNFMTWLGTDDMRVAQEKAQTDPAAVADYAMTYLYPAYQNIKKQQPDLSGEQLIYFMMKNGQRADVASLMNQYGMQGLIQLWMNANGAR